MVPHKLATVFGSVTKIGKPENEPELLKWDTLKLLLWDLPTDPMKMLGEQ